MTAGRVRTTRAADDADAPHDEAAGLRRLRTEELIASSWGNGPGDTYDAHAHAYEKVLYCVDGSITFHTGDGDADLSVGDRLEVPAGTKHSATVGPDGCRCVEAPRRTGA